MALNPDYIPLTSLWELHSDKDTGELLRSGYALFFRDTARTIGKPVFQITGSPPNYTYIEYGSLDGDGAWRIDLNDQGAFDSIPYGYVLDNSGNTDLYFIQFYSMDGVYQFSREGWPQFIADSIAPTQVVEINYVPNGQFRLHLDLPVSSNYEAGQVRSPITHCAFGGWTFDRPIGSTARDFVTFKRFDAYTSNPDKSPRYEIEIECESPSPGDGYKDLRLKFDDVNKFADPVNEFTFAISGKVALGGAINVDLVLIKNYGTGGDTATETTLTTFSLTSTYQIFYYAFCFGTNIGKSIGILNDDYIQLALRFPVDNIYDVVFTDAILTQGNVSSPIFDDTTTRQFIYRSIFSNVCPNPDGSDLYLPMTLSPDGLIPDQSVVATISAKATYSLGKGELDCNGESYESDGYSSDGIPYSRLFNKILANFSGSALPLNIPIFGTGQNFMTVDILDSKDLKISTNNQGATSTPSDGSPATGFIFRNNHVGETDIEAKAYISELNQLVIVSNKVGGGVGFSVGGGNGSTAIVNVNGVDSQSVMAVTIGATVASSSISFDAGNAPSANFVYILWYKVDGVGTAPSALPGTTLIEVDLYTGGTERDIAKITADAISGKQVSQITCAAATAIPTASYFILDTLTQSYYVWYQKDGAGTDPAPSGKIGIKVSISGTDTKDQVTSKTASAINSRYFAVPDLRGLFLKGYKGLSTDSIDLDSAKRFAINTVITGNEVGTREYSNNISHVHTFSSNIESFEGPSSAGTPLYGNDPFDPANALKINDQGGSESRPQNIYVNYFIKY